MTAENRAYKIFYWLVIISFLSLLLFDSSLLSATATKTMWFYLIVELALPVYLYLCLKSYGFRHLKNPVVYLAGAFLATSFISAVVGIDFVHSFWGTFERMQGLYFDLHLFIWLVYLVFLFQTDKTKINSIINWLVGIATVTAVPAIFQLLSGRFPRPYSSFDNPIFFAAFLAIPLFLCLYQGSKTKNYWYLLPAGLMLLGLLSTKSAGAILGLTIGIIVGVLFYFFNQTGQRRWVAAGVLAVLALVGIFLIIKNPDLKNKFQGADAQSRLLEWRIALRGFIEKPIFGVGSENYSYLNNKYFDNRIYDIADNSGFFDKPHNYFLEILTTRGAIGFLIYLGGFGIVIWGLRRLFVRGELSRLEFSILLSGLIAYAVQNFFAFDMFGACLGLMLLFAISSRGWTIDNSRSQIENQSWTIRLSVLSSLVLFVLLCVVNSRIIKANTYLVDALQLSSKDPVAAQNKFDQLTRMPFYADAPRIGQEYELFVNANLTDPIRSIWLDQAIAYNQKIVNQNSANFSNQLSLANLYLSKSQLAGSIDPKVLELCDQMKTQAPNRVESDLTEVVAYATGSQFDKAQMVMDRAQKLAPANLSVIWTKIYLDAFRGETRLALDEAKAPLSMGVTEDRKDQADKLASIFVQRFNYSAAIALYNEALLIHPDYGYFYLQMARVYAISGDKTNAAHVIDTLKQKDYATYEQHSAEINEFLKPATLQVR